MNEKKWNDDTIYGIIKDQITIQLGEEIKISPELKLIEDLGFSSLKLVVFLSEITRKLNLNIFDFFDYELLSLKSIADISTLLSKKLNNEN
jgi:acyl carrier protein